MPTAPEETDKLVMLGADVTVNATPLLAVPLTVTTTFPLVARDGTEATMLVVDQQVPHTVAVVPLNLTVLVPWVAPNPLPVIVTAPPIGAEAGDKLPITGVTVKVTPLLATPPTFTTTFPVVAADGTVTAMLPAAQLVAVATAPLNVTVLEPWVPPKFAPEIVTGVPVGPDEVDKLVMLGAGVTVNGLPPLAVPFTVTTTFPVVAPGGTVATILVVLHVEAVPAEVPLKVTVFVP